MAYVLLHVQLSRGRLSRAWISSRMHGCSKLCADKESGYTGPERSQLKGIDHDCNDIPDAAMTLAVAALFAQGQTRIRNVYNWRVKVCLAASQHTCPSFKCYALLVPSRLNKLRHLCMSHGGRPMP